MPVCIGTYPDNTQLGLAGTPQAFTTQAGKPIPFVYEAETCAPGELRLYSSAEVDNLASSSGNPFVLSVADGVVISGLIVGVWAAAFAVRSLIRALNPSNDGI
ncbi:MAG: hypothetical protein AB7P37_18980 [Ramlibacter sp.]